MAKRVFEVARELGVTSKVVLQKCRAEGLEIKNHMSTLSAGLEATISEWFSEAAGESTAVETAEHVDVAKARKQAAAQQRRRKKSAEKEKAQEPAEEPEAVAQAVAEAPAAEGETQAPEPEPAAPVVVAEAQAPPAGEVAGEVEAVAAEGPAEVKAEAEPARPKAPKKAAKKPEEKPKEKAEKEPEAVKPAGPQVVPKPAVLKGPKVVRVDKPDFVQGPPSRKPLIEISGRAQVPAAGTEPAKEEAGLSEEEERRRKKSKRRSPRRRSTRLVDDGEKLREWRDQDLLERSERLAAATGGLRRRRARVSGKVTEQAPSIRSGRVEVSEPMTVKSLSAATGIKTGEIQKKLMSMGVMATINQVIDRVLAEALVMDYEIELIVALAKSAEDELVTQLESREVGEFTPRAPVVTFLGHVDHGKTSLLDYIRKTRVAEGEAGGITQHIGAYRYDSGGKRVVFLDTPGHEAFTAMRARGANMTDVVVLVVAADDGVMPQTAEAISHARAAEVTVIVALNKIDVPNANVQRALGQLGEQGLQPREWGGDVEVIRTSAVTGEGIDTLVETLSLEAELLELGAEKEAPASGFVIEAQIDPGKGAVASLLVRNGTLRMGEVLLAGKGYGRVRQMLDDMGRPVNEAGPSVPVEVSGLDEVPDAGDKFVVASDIERAREVAQDRINRSRAEELGEVGRVSLESLLKSAEAGEAVEVKLIVKADVQGSVEAIVGAIRKLGTDEARANILHSGVGGISAGDVTLAEASGAIVIGFNVVPDPAARALAEEKGVDIRQYSVIYELIDDIRRAMEEGLAPEIREEVVGHAEVRQVFKISRVGTVAGCYVTGGTAARGAKIRVTRNNIVIGDGRSLESLKRFKEDVREVRADMECGIKIEGYDDIKEGDVLEFYRQVEVARTL